MQLEVNGNQLEVPDSLQSIKQLLSHLNLAQRIVVVELNRKIIDKAFYDGTPIAAGDRVEIVHFVGGG